MDWYCIVNGSQQGPMDSSEVVALLRDGRLTPQDYVWTPAFGDQWRRAADVPEFAVPPPMASAPVASEPVAQTPLTGVPGNRPFFRAAVGHAWDRMVSVLFRRSISRAGFRSASAPGSRPWRTGASISRRKVWT